MAGEVFKRDIGAALPPGGIVSAPLGDTVLTKFVQADVGKAVKFQNGAGAVAGTFEAVLCVAGDRIDGFVSSVNPDTVNSGYSFGGVQILGDKEVQVGTVAVPIGSLIQFESGGALGTAGIDRVVPKVSPTLNIANVAALGTAVEAALLAVKKETDWMCTQIKTGTGAAAGDTIIIERVI